ncbi:MAG: glycosyltransferase family 2 protein [Planctomycetota bacterium]|nr:MAG: glycosyltransferase family 2 protein [Planctomycetota bacterium]
MPHPWGQIAQAVFWGCCGGLLYIYVGYPLLVWLMARFRPRRAHTGEEVHASPVSVVIAAHNEEQRIAEKLRNLLASRDVELVDVWVGSDGSTDGTVAAARSVDDPRVCVVEFRERRGKASVLNDLVPRCAGDIVVFVDVRQELERDAIARLVAALSDPTVGVASGELRFRPAETERTVAARGVGAYWSYERWIRRNESGFRGVPGATGALYAMRKSLFRPIPPQTILDDVVIPMQAVEQGYRCVFVPDAIAWDTPSTDCRAEAIRKRRTIAGAAQLVWLRPRWLLPWKNPLWWEFVSHKLARLASPVLLIAALCTSAALAAVPLYRLLLVLQGVFYASAAVGWGLQRAGRSSRCCAVQLMFVTLNAVTLAALWDALRGHCTVRWRRAV